LFKPEFVDESMDLMVAKSRSVCPSTAKQPKLAKRSSSLNPLLPFPLPYPFPSPLLTLLLPSPPVVPMALKCECKRWSATAALIA
jgi:hypothetical protein